MTTKRIGRHVYTDVTSLMRKGRDFADTSSGLQMDYACTGCKPNQREGRVQCRLLGILGVKAES
jgi:hypothetical protein